jgi:hypothetical protein
MTHIWNDSYTIEHDRNGSDAIMLDHKFECKLCGITKYYGKIVYDKNNLESVLTKHRDDIENNYPASCKRIE